MILAWISARGFLGLAKGLWLLLVALAVASVIAYFVSAEKADDKANQNIGATSQRETDLRETVKKVEQGNAAREEIRAPDRAGACARYAQCVRSSRPSAAANCVRFLPEQSTGFGCRGPVK